MSTWNFIEDCYLAYLSKPAGVRCLYRALQRTSVRSVVEVGLRDGERTCRLLKLAGRKGEGPVRYTGIDLFEARGGSAVSLKMTHQLLKRLPVKVQLIPGDAFSGLARSANGLAETDLLLVCGEHDAESLERAWFYVPRMLHPGSLVFVERNPGTSNAQFEQLSLDEVQRLAAIYRPGAAKAA